MRTDDLRPSSNVEDDREASASRGISGGAGGLSIGAVIIIGLISWYFGIDPSVLLNGYQNLTSGNSGSEQTSSGSASHGRGSERSDWHVCRLNPWRH